MRIDTNASAEINTQLYREMSLLRYKNLQNVFSVNLQPKRS